MDKAKLCSNKDVCINAPLPAAEFELFDYIADFLKSVYIKVRSPYRVRYHLKKRIIDESFTCIEYHTSPPVFQCQGELRYCFYLALFQRRKAWERSSH